MKVKNALISQLFTKLDFPIRFIYVRTGFVSELLNKVMFWKLYTSDFSHLDNRFNEMTYLLAKAGFDAKGKKVLELGPGNSYINAYRFLKSGAEKIFLVDKYPRYSTSKKQQNFIEREREYVFSRYGEADTQKIELHSVDLTETSGITVDLICSISVMEHVKLVKENIKKMYEFLNPGGYMYHRIDLRDHYNFSEPFLFYKYSDAVWNSYLTKEGLSYTNRIRYSDWVELFKGAGFEIVSEYLEKEPLKVPQNVNEMFIKKTHDDLSTSVVQFVLKKV